MVKHQVNVRVSDLTRDKLDFLSEYYGTQAEAVAIAIDRLYRETRYGYEDDFAPDPEVFASKHTGDEALRAGLGEKEIRVLIVDGEPHIQGNLAKMLHSEPHVEVVGTAAGGEEGIALAKKLQPHIILMDRLMPGMDGLAATRAITEQVPYTRVIMTSVHGAESLRRSMLAGARDCLSRPFRVGELMRSIYRVYAMAPYPRPHAMPTVQESSLSSEELAGLRQAVQAMEYVKDLLSRHPELVEDEKE
jgi:DNA-binding NarL/FixJ family response regulator